MSLCCQQDDRRDAVRRMKGLNGLDYVEVPAGQTTLYAYFLGKLPAELQSRKTASPHLRIEGGRRITGIQITGAEPVIDPDPEKDDYLVITVDKPGDFSTYTLRLSGVANIDPRYTGADFSFKVDCPSDLDCAPACACEATAPDEIEINYLAKDYGSFRQLILDRLAVVMPGWRERHAPDLEIALVEILAYTGDYLSYYQDAVATEAYLDTARKRISVRRHARLVDYILHEGCNARALVAIETSGDFPLDPKNSYFITGLNDALAASQTVLQPTDFSAIPSSDYEVFEPAVSDLATKIPIRAAHSEISIYTWGNSECCLERGSTSATLLDAWNGKNRALQLTQGDILIFEEVTGPKTGLAADADPARRHAVRLTGVTPGEDPVTAPAGGPATPYVEIQWAQEDALPFTFCLSAIGPPPDCRYITGISVARGNVILVDHGATQDAEPLGPVPVDSVGGACECAGEPGDIQAVPGRFKSRLSKAPVTFRAALPAGNSPASSTLAQDVRNTLPQIWLTSDPPKPWEPRYDLIGSGPADWHFVAEIEDRCYLRFGDGDLGAQPTAGMTFQVTYRVGNGAAGNVGPDSISRLVLKNHKLSGLSLTIRNPLPAAGGTDPEPVAQARLLAPFAFRKTLERAIVAADYETIAERNPEVQRASARLQWTGSWYEADVAIDAFGTETASPSLVKKIDWYLERYRRMGHDLAVVPARYVPLDIALTVCALPSFERGHVKAALLAAFGTGRLPGGKLAYFHPDNLTFGEGIYMSRIIAAAQKIAGVECIRVTRFQRLFEAPDHEIENGVLPLRNSEIAQLDNDPDFPERGTLEISVSGGR